MSFVYHSQKVERKKKNQCVRIVAEHSHVLLISTWHDDSDKFSNYVFNKINYTNTDNTCFVKPVNSAQRCKDTRRKKISSGLPSPKFGKIRRKSLMHRRRTSCMAEHRIKNCILATIFFLQQLCIVMLNYKKRLQDCRASHSGTIQT